MNGKQPAGPETQVYFARRHSYTQARRHERLPVDLPVTVTAADGSTSERAANLSEGGVGLQSGAERLTPMALVTLHLELPHGLGRVELLGRVMWAQKSAAGIRFESTDPRLFEGVNQLRRDLERL